MQAGALYAQSRFGVLSFEQKLDALVLWTKALERHPAARDPAHVDALLDLYAEIEASHEAVSAGVPAALAASPTPDGCKWQVVRELVDLSGAMLRGYWHDLIVPDQPFESLDSLDFRAWLLENGATPAIVQGSSITHALYDTMFQYVDGDVARPSYAAGAALGVLTRMIGTFKGSVMWNIQAGMGEAVVAPVYDVLRANGVAFRFFRRVTRLEAAGGAVSRIQLEVQAQETQQGISRFEGIAGTHGFDGTRHQHLQRHRRPRAKIVGGFRGITNIRQVRGAGEYD